MSTTSQRLREAFRDYNHPSNPRGMVTAMANEMKEENPDWAVVCYTAMWTAYLVATHQRHWEWLEDGNEHGALTSIGIGGPLLEEMMKDFVVPVPPAPPAEAAHA